MFENKKQSEKYMWHTDILLLKGEN